MLTLLLLRLLKEHVPTSCSTCELHALKNLKLAHYVDHWQDLNDELKTMMGWLSGHEPHLRMMIEAYKRYDGQVLGSDKTGECSGEGREKIGDIQAPQKTFHKKAYAPKPNPLKNKLVTTLDPHIFPHPTNDFQNQSSSRVNWEMSSLGKRVRSRVRRNQVSSPNPSQNLSSYNFIVIIVGEMVTRVSLLQEEACGENG
jgi:hypothetical protein